MCCISQFPTRNDSLHIFLVYIHPNSIIEENIFIKARLCKYSVVIDFNLNKTKSKQLRRFLEGGIFTRIHTNPTFLMENNPDSTPDIILQTSNLKNSFIEVELVADLG